MDSTEQTTLDPQPNAEGTFVMGDEEEEIPVEQVDEGGLETQRTYAEQDDMEEEWFDYEDVGGGDSLGDEEGDLSLCDSDDCENCMSDGELDLSAGTKEKIGWTGQVRMIHMRRYIDQLAEKVIEKDYAVQKTREELSKCRLHIEQLETERDGVFQDIQVADSNQHMSALYRLRAQHERLCKELQSEGELEEKIAKNLDKAEYELAQAQVEQGKMLLAEDELLKKEEKLLQERKEASDVRNKKETDYANQAIKNRKTALHRHEEAMIAREERINQMANDAKKSQEKANKFLKKTIDKLKQRELEEEERQKQHMEKRMTTMMALKSDIVSNRENLKALQARDKAIAEKKKQEEDSWINSILDNGGNPSEELIKSKKLEDFEKQKQIHKLKQRERQTEIAEKILIEEDRMRKRRQQQPQLFLDPAKEREKEVKPHRKRKIRILEHAAEPEPESFNFPIDESKFEGKTGDESDDDDTGYSLSATNTKESIKLVPEGSSDEEESNVLAKPEFDGLWDQHKAYKVPRDIEDKSKLPGASKMEKSIMERVLSKHRDGIVVKQVAGGKEFRGCAFYSKPDVIHFKDFDVGKTYKKKVTLTNVSYSVNYCKLTGLTEHLKDFIELSFDPPGQMSAGLTCELFVTFKPMINEDLEGTVQFLSQTGPFEIPLVCTTKKCALKVDYDCVDFGTTVIGETLKRSFTLINEGALGTKFEFYKVTAMKGRDLTTAETSLGRLTTADTGIRVVSPDSEDVTEKSKAKDKPKMATDKIEEKPEEEKVEEKKDGEKKEEIMTERTEAMDTEHTGETTERTQPDTIIPASDSPLPAQDMEELYSLDGMKVGPLSSGEIGPFSSVKLEIIWQPTIPGRSDTEFIVSFSDPESPQIQVQALAQAIDVPVWVERSTVDLKICMFDRLYQDTVTVNNRATTALRLKFEVCKELRNHLELLPKTGYVQAQSQFSAQLKFLPRKSLFEEAGKFFDKDTGVLEAPMIIRVAEQTRPVPFTVQAVVTNSELSFDMTSIDFGHCTIHEAVKATVKLTNQSILPQQFGFVGIPEYVDVQPNDGFGTLLPLETIDLDIIFHPSKARDYQFELTCKSLINREFKIKCKGVGVHTPLELSKQVIHLRATSLYDVSSASLHVVNSHTSVNEFTHPVPRMGKGEIAPVCPTSFEFVVPKDAPFTMSPSVGTVEPGSKCRVQVRFSPTLDEANVKKEAVRIVTRQLEVQAVEEYKQALQREKEKEEAAAGANKNEKGKGKPPAKGKPSPKGRGKGAPAEANALVSVKGPAPVQPPVEDSIKPQSSEFAAAKASLLRQFGGRFQTFTIPCYVASGKCANPGELPYSVHNTLYVEVHCPTLRPELVVISDSGNTTTDFGDVSIGQSVIKSVTIQNISDKDINLQSSLLDSGGPFQLLNALRVLPPNASHTLLMCFTPHKGEVFQEVLEIMTPTSSMSITLKGKGVSPMICLSVEGGVIDMGGVLSGEYREETFKINNTSTLAVQYAIKLDSQSLLRHSKAQGIPTFIKADSSSKSLVGTQNLNGEQVFDCVPAEGTIPAGGSTEIMVTFAPDHDSEHYSDGIRIELFGMEEAHSFKIIGEARSHIMYLTGGDPLRPDVESLAVLPPVELEEDAKPPAVPLLVSLHSLAKETEYSVATRDIHAGCVRTMAVSQKKGGRQNGEWSFDNLAPIQALGFNIDPAKGMVEAGTLKPITVTWTPQPGFDPNQPAATSILCTLKGDVTEQFKVMLRGFVISE